MSSQRSNSGRYGNGTLSGSLGRGGGSGPGGSGPFTKGYGSGLVSLGTTKKPRTVSSLPERKLSVPKPVNLPSLRKENAGNDPNTQLVPSGGGGGWQKPEQKTEESLSQEPAPNLTAGSSWASTPSTSGVPSWQPPQPFPVAAAVPPRARSLNPHEYPSLTAAAAARQSIATKPVPHLPAAGSQGGGNWDEDERKPTLGPQGRSTGESWADSHFEDDEKPAFRLQWESNGRPEWRGPPNEGPYRAFGGEDHWSARGAPTARAGYPPKPLYGAYDRFREVEDPTLFPPPPPPRHLPPPPPPPRVVEQTKEEAEAEKRAFEAEIDRVIEEERQRKKEMLEAARMQPPQEEEPEPVAEPIEEPISIKPPPPPPPPPPLTDEQQTAAAEAARQKVIALRKQREAEAEEEERKRKEAAAAKLKELEERIARKNAEKLAKEKEAGPPESAESTASAEAPAEAVLKEVEEAAAEAIEASAEGAAEAARNTVSVPRQPDLPHSLSKDSLSAKGASSVEVEASSSVGQAEIMAELESLGDTAGNEAASDSSASAWKKPLAANQPRAIWQRRDRDPAKGELLADSLPPGVNAVLPVPGPEVSLPRTSAADSGASSLFAARSGFGPALVATSLGISPEELAAAQKPALSQPDGVKQPAEGTAAPPISGPMSWRAVLGGGEPTPEPAAPEVPKAEEYLRGQAPETPGKGRGSRGRREKEHGPKEDRQALGGRGERGERGRGRQERGRGRGRGRQEGAGKDDVVQAIPAGQAATPDSGPPTPREARKPQRQRGEGRGRGLKSEQSADGGRGRGRGGRGANRIPATTAAAGVPPQASTSAASAISVPPGTVPALPASKPSQPPPPGISPRVVLPPADALLQPHLPAILSREADSWAVPMPKELPPLSQSNISKPNESLSPTLDPVAPMGGPDARGDRAIDRPTDRPKSAAGAVGRPRSGTQDSLPSNGMPVLPNDLSLEGLAEESSSKSTQNPASITFGFQPSQTPSSLAPGPFPGVFFPSQHGSSNPWKPASSSGQSQPNLEAAVQSFYKAGGPSLGSSAFSQPPGSQPPSAGLQFGAFGAHNFPQFGQLSSGFGQLPFIHTGKQPDWSTGPLSSTQGSSGLKTGDPATSAAPGPGFSRSQGLDAIVPPSNIGKRGAQGAPGPPGPPGLQRQAGPVPQLFPAPGLAQHTQALQPPPPGLQIASQQPAPHFSGPPRGAGPFQADQQLHTNFGPLGNHQPQFQQGPPPGIPGPGHSAPPAARDQAAALPDDVFETSDVKLTDAVGLQPPGAANGQARRGGDGRGRGGRLAAGRAQAPGRGRNFVRNHAGRGMPPPPNLAGPPPGNLPFQQMPGGPPGVMSAPHGFAPGNPGGMYNSVGHHPPQLQHEGLAGDPSGSQQGGLGPKREGRGGQHHGGARGKGRGRGDRGRTGQNAKYVYVAHGAGNGGDGAAVQANGPTL